MSDRSDLPLLVRWKGRLLVIGLLLLLVGLVLPAWAFVSSLGDTFQAFDRTLENYDQAATEVAEPEPAGLGSTFGMFLIGLTMIFVGTGAVIVSLITPSADG